MKLYKLKSPVPCNIETCSNTNAILVVQVDDGTNHAVCPECVKAMSDMNNDNEEFFAQEPLLTVHVPVAFGVDEDGVPEQEDDPDASQLTHEEEQDANQQIYERLQATKGEAK